MSSYRCTVALTVTALRRVVGRAMVGTTTVGRAMTGTTAIGMTMVMDGRIRAGARTRAGRTKATEVGRTKATETGSKKTTEVASTKTTEAGRAMGKTTAADLTADLVESEKSSHVSSVSRYGLTVLFLDIDVMLGLLQR